MATAEKSLVIVESPAKARTISAYLPDNFTVEASIGHIRDLPQSAKEIPADIKDQPWSRLGINIEDDFKPCYVIPAVKKKQVAKLKALYGRYGTVSGSLISGSSELVPVSAYARRFGTIDKAYQAIFREVIEEKRSEVVDSLRQNDVRIEQHGDFIVIDGLFSVRIQPTIPIPRGYEASWVFHPVSRQEVDLTVGVLLSCPKQFEVLGCLAFPRQMVREKVRIFTGSPEKADLFSHHLTNLIETLRT